jgi:hypothetical protein
MSTPENVHARSDLGAPSATVEASHQLKQQSPTDFRDDHASDVEAH